jgi:hypothetical protein
LRQRRRAIIVFLEKMDTLLEFQPGPGAPAAAGKIQTNPQ